MREVKFKLWSINENDWVRDREGGILFPELLLTTKSGVVYCQFTGNYDSKGNEIYYGDKIKTLSGGVMVIKETKNGWMPFLGNRQSGWELASRGTIIGNIFAKG